MGRLSLLFAWLPIIVMLVLTGSAGRKRSGLELAFGAGKLKAVINFYPKGSEFLLKGDYTLAVGKGKMDRCVLAWRCLQTE
jgi:hypothetical protein